MSIQKFVWIFQGDNARFPSAIFSSKLKATTWIRRNDASGILTEYPIDISVYDWAINKEYFVPKTDYHSSIEFRQQFTSANQRHSHCKNGVELE